MPCEYLGHAYSYAFIHNDKLLELSILVNEKILDEVYVACHSCIHSSNQQIILL